MLTIWTPGSKLCSSAVIKVDVSRTAGLAPRAWVVVQEPPLKVVAREPPTVRDNVPSGMGTAAEVPSPKVIVITWLLTRITLTMGADTKSMWVTTVEMNSNVI